MLRTDNHVLESDNLSKEQHGGAMLSTSDEEDQTVYKVVVNDEEQYSIWPAHRENPNGWRDAGKSGLKPDCLSYINEVWTDMRPLSLRKAMEEHQHSRTSNGE
jgi:MbtH protein